MRQPEADAASSHDKPKRSRAETVRLRLGLTPREWSVVTEMLAGNDASKGIGRALGLSPRTVDVHIASVCGKLEVASKLRAALIIDRALRRAG